MKNTEKNKSVFYKASYTPADKTACKPVLCGSEKGIVSFAVALFASACGGEKSNNDNGSFYAKLEKDLKHGHLLYIPIKGKDSDAQNPYMILNPNLEDMKYLFASYNCASFVFAVKNQAAECMEYQYWEKDHADGSYTLSRKNDSVSSFKEVNTFFRMLPLFDFVFDSSFDSFLKEFIAPYIENDGYYEKLHEQVYCINKTPKHRRMQRCFMYETAEQKQKRMQSLSDSNTKEAADRFACADDILVVRARSYAKRMQAESTRAHTDF